MADASTSSSRRYLVDKEPPRLVMGYASVASLGGTSILQADVPTAAEPFRSSDSDRATAERKLAAGGFELVADSPLGYAIAGPPEAYEQFTGGTIRAFESLEYAEFGRPRYVTHLDITGEGQPGDVGVAVPRDPESRVEGVFLERPRIPAAVFPSPLPPNVSKYHLRVPDDVALLLGAVQAHRDGHLGKGVRVAMVDSGQYAHPFFTAHGYDVQRAVSVIPGTSPDTDPDGHGTGESANVFALAPAATLEPYRAADDAGKFVGAIGGFLAAKKTRPTVLTNSWGGNLPYPPTRPLDAFNRAWAAEILDAVESGILVVFAAGNSSFAVEAQVPGVLTAGGAYVSRGLALRASNYASGYESPFYTGRTVPDLCGLVGLMPRAQYIMLPVPPGCPIDVDEAQPAEGDSADGTSQRDGWALFSGTSAAAPQLAGAAAMILGARPGLTPAQVRQAMVETAFDVRVGRNHSRFNIPATPGFDAATGAGLLNASAAVERALAL